MGINFGQQRVAFTGAHTPGLPVLLFFPALCCLSPRGKSAETGEVGQEWSLQRAGKGGVNQEEWAASSLRVSNREAGGISQPDPKRKNWL